MIAQSQQLEAVITQACNELPKLQIPAKAASVENIQKLVVAVKESKVEIGKVRFKLQLQISELQLKL